MTADAVTETGTQVGVGRQALLGDSGSSAARESAGAGPGGGGSLAGGGGRGEDSRRGWGAGPGLSGWGTSWRTPPRPPPQSAAADRLLKVRVSPHSQPEGCAVSSVEAGPPQPSRGRGSKLSEAHRGPGAQQEPKPQGPCLCPPLPLEGPLRPWGAGRSLCRGGREVRQATCGKQRVCGAGRRHRHHRLAFSSAVWGPDTDGVFG